MPQWKRERKKALSPYSQMFTVLPFNSDNVLVKMTIFGNGHIKIILIY